MVAKEYKGRGKMSADTQLQDFKNKKIEGYANTCSAFAEEQYQGKRYFLLENDEYDDETSYLLYDVAANTVIGDTFIGFSELPDFIDKCIYVTHAPLVFK